MWTAWFNNVETKPGSGYPKAWENPDRWSAGWVRRANGEIVPRQGGKWQLLMKIFANPNLPQIDDHHEPFIAAPTKQMLPIVSRGLAGLACFVGLTILLYRRIFDPRIRLTSHRTDLAILVILWVQLCLGLLTLPFSYIHRADAGAMLVQ